VNSAGEQWPFATKILGMHVAQRTVQFIFDTVFKWATKGAT
jgi:hypothetical protein